MCRIFMDKAKELIKDLTERNVMGEHEAMVYSMEHQKRGLPHLHILLILKKDDKLDSPDFVNEYVAAEIPTLPVENDKSPEAEQQKRLYNVIIKNNIHDCTDKSGCRVDGKCSKGFPKKFSDETHINGANNLSLVLLTLFRL